MLGLETDIQYADLGGDRNDLRRRGIFVGDSSDGIDWFGTVRARAGFAFDRALIYATGGFAYGDIGNRSNGFVGTAFTAAAATPAPAGRSAAVSNTPSPTT